MLVHGTVLHVCFTVLTNTELAGVNIRLLFFPHSCKDQYAAWTRAKFCKTGFKRCLFLLLF